MTPAAEQSPGGDREQCVDALGTGGLETRKGLR